MSVITRELLQALDTNIRTTFQKRFDSTPGLDDWKQIASVVPSEGASEKYSWLGAVPGLREFKSERVPGTLSGFNYEITNKKWESTLDVDRDVIEDDRTGNILLAVQTLAAKAATHYPRLIATAFDQAFTTTVWDGENFFDADHPGGSNYLGTAKDLTAANFDAAELLLAGQKDDRGDLLGYRGDTIVVGPGLEAAANRVINRQEILESGVAVSNPYFQRYKVVVLPYLDITSKKWAIVDSRQGVLPFVMQIRVGITLLSKTDINSDRAFDKDIFTWGTRARHNAGYGNHQVAVGAIAN